MKRTSIFFPGPLMFLLRERAEKMDLPIADIIRRAIHKFLDDEEAKERKQK